MKPVALFLLLVTLIAGAPRVTARQNYAPAGDLEALHRPLDALLDMYVRDGLVYYNALRGDRGRLSQYLASLNAPSVVSAYESWPKPQQMAFWINAYNATVLDTVVAHYPIRGRASGYPSESIRQIPGAFEAAKHQLGGRPLTLDEVETKVLAPFNDPRVFLVLGRGAIGSGRLRSEAFGGESLERQLAQSAEQFGTMPKYITIDALGGKVGVSPILSWRSAQFIAGYADKSLELPKRTPIELAVIGFIRPRLLPAEEEFIKKNTFQLTYLPFDWRLNDLTGQRH